MNFINYLILLSLVICLNVSGIENTSFETEINGYINCTGICGECDRILKNKSLVDRFCEIGDYSQQNIRYKCCKTWKDFRCLINIAAPLCQNSWPQFKNGVWNKTLILNSTDCKSYPYGSDLCMDSATSKYELSVVSTFALLSTLLALCK